MNHRGKKHVEAEVNTMSSFSLSAYMTAVM